MKEVLERLLIHKESHFHELLPQYW
ncbi:hypothetical protein KG088_17760 [Halomonas sp. TRM85114]|nr:hypothetical protein [Halomonas jincaotanensis]